MDYLDLTLPTAAANLALDEALLLEAAADTGGEVLRFWEWPAPAVVLGAGCRLAADVNEAACRADDVPILRRASGGGTVLLGSGCLLYSLVLAYDRSPRLREIPPSYVYILDPLRAALGGEPAGIDRAGTSDLTAAGRKFSGNAQQRKRKHLLHHGTLLYHFDVDLVGRYLHSPLRQPDYRQGRSHAAFLHNLATDAAKLKLLLQAVWKADNPLKNWPEDMVGCLTQEKYTQPEWVYRR